MKNSVIMGLLCCFMRPLLPTSLTDTVTTSADADEKIINITSILMTSQKVRTLTFNVIPAKTRIYQFQTVIDSGSSPE